MPIFSDVLGMGERGRKECRVAEKISARAIGKAELLATETVARVCGGSYDLL